MSTEGGVVRAPAAARRLAVRQAARRVAYPADRRRSAAQRVRGGVGWVPVRRTGYAKSNTSGARGWTADPLESNNIDSATVIAETP